MEKTKLKIKTYIAKLIPSLPQITEGKVWTIEPPLPLHTFRPLIGFDPGTVNIGIAIASSETDTIWLTQIKFEREKDAVDRMKLLNEFLSTNIYLPTRVTGVVEGAAFGGNNFRQVELAEMRATFVWWLIRHDARTIKIVPPTTIRKQVFGSGRLMAHDIWDNSEIPNDALAALSCLYYADYLETL